MTDLRIAIIIGSTRPGRNGLAVAQWVNDLVQQRDDASYEIVGLLDFNLPHLDEAIPASMGHYADEHTKAWAAKVAEFDAGRIFGRLHQLVPDGVDAVLELVGTTTLQDSLRAIRVHGVACFVGMVSSEWTAPDCYPIGYIPRGVRLTAYGGGAPDRPPALLQAVIAEIVARILVVPIDHIYQLDEFATAHQALEDGTTVGKLVVVT